MGSKNNSQTRFAQDLDMNVRLEKFSEGFRGLGFGYTSYRGKLCRYYIT